jgi:DNA repair protein RecN (Recombination protein N)
LVQLYSQHSQQQLLEPPYPKHWLDRYSNFYAEANDVREAYSTWQRNIRQHQAALDAQATRLQRIATLELQIEELEKSFKPITKKSSKSSIASVIMNISCKTVAIV